MHILGCFCLSSLPIRQFRYGTGGQDAVRIVMYSEGYGDERLAAERVGEVAKVVKYCSECRECMVQCSRGIDIKAAAKRASLFMA